MSASSSILATLSQYPLSALTVAASRARVTTPQFGSAAVNANVRVALSPFRGLRYLVDSEVSRLQLDQTRVGVASNALSSVESKLEDALALIDANRDTDLSDTERERNQAALDDLLEEINTVGSETAVDGRALLDGTATLTAGSTTYAIGAVNTASIGTTTIGETAYALDDLAADGALNIVDGDLDDAASVVQSAYAAVTAERTGVATFSSERLSSSLSVASTAMIALAHAESGLTSFQDADALAEIARSDVLDRLAAAPLAISTEMASTVLRLIGPTAA